MKSESSSAANVARPRAALWTIIALACLPVTAALTQHPRPMLYWGGGPQALPGWMGYALMTDRWSYHEWRNFKTDRTVGQEIYDEQTDRLDALNQAGAVDAASHIPALAEQLDALTKGTKR